MLKYDVRFCWKNGTETASWQHIDHLYDLHCHEDDDIRMLHKLKEEHVRKHRIKQIKMKNVAQVFSHMVQSTMTTYDN